MAMPIEISNVVNHGNPKDTQSHLHHSCSHGSILTCSPRFIPDQTQLER